MMSTALYISSWCFTGAVTATFIAAIAEVLPRLEPYGPLRHVTVADFEDEDFYLSFRFRKHDFIRILSALHISLHDIIRHTGTGRQLWAETAFLLMLKRLKYPTTYFELSKVTRKRHPAPRSV